MPFGYVHEATDDPNIYLVSSPGKIDVICGISNVFIHIDHILYGFQIPSEVIEAIKRGNACQIGQVFINPVIGTYNEIPI